MGAFDVLLVDLVGFGVGIELCLGQWSRQAEQRTEIPDFFHSFNRLGSKHYKYNIFQKHPQSPDALPDNKRKIYRALRRSWFVFCISTSEMKFKKV